MNNEISKKIKSQKNAAILLIIVPMIMLILYLGNSNFEEYRINNYIICGGLIVLIICGGIGLNNSLRKQREL